MAYVPNNQVRGPTGLVQFQTRYHGNHLVSCTRLLLLRRERSITTHQTIKIRPITRLILTLTWVSLTRYGLGTVLTPLFFTGPRPKRYSFFVLHFLGSRKRHPLVKSRAYKQLWSFSTTQVTHVCSGLQRRRDNHQRSKRHLILCHANTVSPYLNYIRTDTRHKNRCPLR